MLIFSHERDEWPIPDTEVVMAIDLRRGLTMKSRILSILLVATALVLVVLPASADESGMNGASGGSAVFEDQVIDLVEGWGEAKACLAWDSDTMVECFRSEAELLERVSQLESATLDQTKTRGAAGMSSTCSSSVRLYDGTSYSGSVLYLYQRSSWINLTNHGWSNRTSSFKVGACSSYFADYSNGGGSWYPTSLTQAWDVASSMISGWNKRISSIYIS
jgi:hypothetical protein